MTLTSHITSKHENAILVMYLATRFTYLSVEQWRERILEHSILLNQGPADPGYILKKGDVVSYDVPDFTEPKADINYTIAYEDEWIFAVNKTGNLLVHKAGKSITNNLVFLLRHASGNPSYASAHAVSRLDRETSGIVLFAKDPGCLKALHKDFAAGAVSKEYLAVVHGAPKEIALTVDLPIGPDVSSSVTYKFCINKENGKKSVTRLETLATSGRYSMVRARPVTGRTHQIRIHCAVIGCPVVGDKLYGLTETEYLTWRNDPEKYSSLLEFPRQALHCARLTFKHPITKNELSINAPIPLDMAGLMEKFGLDNGRV
jgi:RluA family pseudouridine synthase